MGTEIQTTQGAQLSKQQSRLPLSMLLKQRSQVLTQNSVKQKSEQALAYLDKHEDINEWAMQFGVEAQITLCDPSIALGCISSLDDDDCPSLGMFKICYGQSAINWMKQHIDVLNVISSVQNKLSDQQITMLAMDIFSQYYYWNLGDVCVFFGKVRRGQYGHFYGTVDNLMIMEWAKEFDKERRVEIEKFENAIARRRKDIEKKNSNNINFDEYYQSLTDEQKKNSIGYAVFKNKAKLFNSPLLEEKKQYHINK